MKEETKKKFKKVLSVAGVLVGGAAIGAGAVIVGKKVMGDDSDVITVTNAELEQYAKNAYNDCMIDTLKAIAKKCEEREDKSLVIASYSTEESPDAPGAWLVGKLLYEEPKDIDNPMYPANE